MKTHNPGTTTCEVKPVLFIKPQITIIITSVGFTMCTVKDILCPQALD